MYTVYPTLMLCYSLVVVELKSTEAQKIWGTLNLTQLQSMLEVSQTLPIWTAGAVGRMISSSHLDQDNIHPSASPDQGVLKNVESLAFFLTL